ncbi:MAG TPA: T9SS type A sorting domain-containing protein, partial [Bacteroidales bacterium]|nr:T9SS type A sorting domain-containing protein [Bacteroidales bacterium]
LILRFNQTIYNEVNISIYNVTGQILFCKNYNLNNLPTRIIRIDDLKNEINGIYILKVETKDDIFTTKIIKTE